VRVDIDRRPALARFADGPWYGSQLRARCDTAAAKHQDLVLATAVLAALSGILKRDEKQRGISPPVRC
jgi:hypothetical protein